MLVLYYECINLLFQSEVIDKLPVGQKTFVVLARAYQVDVYEARMRLFPKFVAEKRSWIEDISRNLLGIKKHELDDYLSDFLRPDMPLDKIGILMFSRMMHKHCVVFFNDLWWTTRKDNHLSKVDCWLIYHGKCQYTDTIPLTKEEWEARKPYLESVEKHFFSNPDKNLQSTTEESDKETCTVQKMEVIGSIKKVENNDEDKLLKDVEASFDVDVKKPKRKPKSKPKPSVPLRRNAQIKQQDDLLTSGILSSLHSTNSDLLDLHSTTADDSGVHSTSQDSTIDSKPGRRKTCNSLRAAAAALAVSASNHNRSKAASNQGKFSIQRFQLKKRHKTRKPKKCSSCKEDFPTYAELEKHVKKDHPNFKYKCRYCPKTFNSASWKYQHQARHKGLRYQCSVDSCSKLFQFGYQLRDHIKKHTKKALYTCSSPGCSKGFTTKHARTYHQKQHSMIASDKFLCDYKFPQDSNVCGKSFQRKNLLKQHMNGHIGQQLTTYCSKIYNWPNARKYHQDNCKDCTAVKEKNKAVYRFKKEK